MHGLTLSLTWNDRTPLAMSTAEETSLHRAAQMQALEPVGGGRALTGRALAWQGQGLGLPPHSA